jgi:hypothetical protein
MILKKILQNLADDGNPVLVNNDRVFAEAKVHLSSLSEMMSKREAYLQPGMYIAEITETGYLGQVLYRFK